MKPGKPKALVAIGILTVACMATARADDPMICKVGLASFAKTVHPMLRNHCIACHDLPAQGPVQGPPHSVADPTASYDRISSYMNFTDLDHSYFVEKGGNKHCVAYGVDCGIGKEDVLQAVHAWWDQGESQCPHLSKIQTTQLDLPTPPQDSGFVKLRWDLSNLGGAFAGSWFELQVQRFVTADGKVSGAYRFREPRLETPKAALHIQDIRILVNGKFDPQANAYISVDRIVPPGMLPLLSDRTLIVAQDTKADQISIAFGRLETAPAPQCRKLDQFRSSALPIFEIRRCYSCHGGGANQEPGDGVANQRWNMEGSDADLCVASLARSDLSNPMDSVLISYSLKGMNGHPKILQSSAEAAGWLSWLKTEKGE